MPFPCSLKREYQFHQDLYKHTISKTLWSEEGKATCMSTSKHELGLRSTAKVSLREVAKLGQPYSTSGPALMTHFLGRSSLAVRNTFLILV
jgi:hypothetical protein